jgi:hypothetical protein
VTPARARRRAVGAVALLVGLGALDASHAVAASKSTAAAKKTTKKRIVKTTATTAPAKTPTTRPVAATATGTKKLNANTATIDEMAAAFAAAGISNANRWAAEVDEYRPYPDDPKWGMLRHELGKYNIDPAVLEKIISLLEI